MLVVPWTGGQDPRLTTPARARLQVHQAADGALVRMRLPGGMITAAQLAALARTLDGFGSGTLELTARGNVQLRGITDVSAVADAIAAAGLLPSATHERVRNIVASPLSGRVGGRPTCGRWVDRAGRRDPRRAAARASCAGRFWFSLDDGRGDVSGLAPTSACTLSTDGAGAAAGRARHRCPARGR